MTSTLDMNSLHYDALIFQRTHVSQTQLSSIIYLLVLSQADGVVSAVEGDKLRLEENVTVDAEVALGGLNTTEASC